MSESKKRTIDGIAEIEYNRWLAKLTKDGTRYIWTDRDERIGMLMEMFVEKGVDYDTAITFKRKTKKDLIHDDGRKATNKKGHKWYGWEEKILTDFDTALHLYYDPNSGISVEKVVFQNSKFKMPENPELVEWIKNKYGDSPDLIEQAHVVNNKLCIEYFTELERSTLNAKA